MTRSIRDAFREGQALSRWSGPLAARLSGILLVCAAMSLFLSSAGTVTLTYTIRPSNALAFAASVVGAPFVIRGWRRCPASLRWSALVVLVTYGVAAVLGDNTALKGQDRAGQVRGLVYLVDLSLGVAIIGLVRGLWDPTQVSHRLVRALAFGVVLGAIYGIYQWFAQHFGWPLSDVNNTLDSGGRTSGGMQGNALFGWERIRGTFLEPHIFGAFLAPGIFLCVHLTRSMRPWGWARLPFATGLLALVAAALLLTSSLPAWASFLLAVLVTGTVWMIQAGRPLAAGLLSAFTVVVVAAGVVAFGAPEKFASITGRSAAEITDTVAFRVHAWQTAGDIWSRRPTFGHGPGQSSVQQGIESLADAPPGTPPVLASSQGLWAAALIDAGIIGLLAWILFISTLLVLGARMMVREWTATRMMAFGAATTGLIGAQIAGDRLELSTWFLIAALVGLLPTPDPSPVARRHGLRRLRGNLPSLGEHGGQQT